METIYICRGPPPTLQNMGHHRGIEFANFRVIKAWQFYKYNVRRDPIFEVETLMGTYQVKEIRSATSHDPSMSQLVLSPQS